MPVMVAKAEVVGTACLLECFTTVSLAVREPDVRTASVYTVQQASRVHMYTVCSELMGITADTLLPCVWSLSVCHALLKCVCPGASDERSCLDDGSESLVMCANGGNRKQANFKANKNLAQIYGAVISFHDQLCCELN